MQSLGCILLVLLVAGPLVGLISIASVVPSAIRGRVSRARCPLCGYDEVGRASDANCPECGLDRHAAELAAWRPRRWPMIAPVIVAAVCSIGLIALTTHLSAQLLAWTVIWHAVPFVMLAVAGGMPGVRRWRMISWLAVGVPLVLLAAGAIWQGHFVAFPSPPRPGSDLYMRDITQRLGPPLFGVFCSGLIGWWLAGIALVLSVRGPLAAAPLTVSEDSGACGKCGYDLAGLPRGAVCPECGEETLGG